MEVVEKLEGEDTSLSCELTIKAEMFMEGGEGFEFSAWAKALGTTFKVSLLYFVFYIQYL